MTRRVNNGDKGLVSAAKSQKKIKTKIQSMKVKLQSYFDENMIKQEENELREKIRQMREIEKEVQALEIVKETQGEAMDEMNFEATEESGKKYKKLLTKTKEKFRKLKSEVQEMEKENKAQHGDMVMTEERIRHLNTFIESYKKNGHLPDVDGDGI